MQIIPFKEPAEWQSQNNLSNVIFLLSFKWNALNEYWTMSIYNRNDEPICLGIKVVPNFNLTEQFVADGMPAGDIICQNILNQWNEIKRFDMGETTELFYYVVDELKSLSDQLETDS